MNTTYNNTCIKPIATIVNKSSVPTGLTAGKKERMVIRHLNQSRYEFLGFVGRTNDVVLRPRFYNVRDKQGRFAAIEA